MEKQKPYYDISDIVKVGKSGSTYHRPDGKFLSRHELKMIEANADLIREGEVVRKAADHIDNIDKSDSSEIRRMLSEKGIVSYKEALEMTNRQLRDLMADAGAEKSGVYSNEYRENRAADESSESPTSGSSWWSDTWPRAPEVDRSDSSARGEAEIANTPPTSSGHVADSESKSSDAEVIDMRGSELDRRVDEDLMVELLDKDIGDLIENRELGRRYAIAREEYIEAHARARYADISTLGSDFINRRPWLSRRRDAIGKLLRSSGSKRTEAYERFREVYAEAEREALSNRIRTFGELNPGELDADARYSHKILLNANEGARIDEAISLRKMELDSKRSKLSRKVSRFIGAGTAMVIGGLTAAINEASRGGDTLKYLPPAMMAGAAFGYAMEKRSNAQESRGEIRERARVTHREIRDLYSNYGSPDDTEGVNYALNMVEYNTDEIQRKNMGRVATWGIGLGGAAGGVGFGMYEAYTGFAGSLGESSKVTPESSVSNAVSTPEVTPTPTTVPEATPPAPTSTPEPSELPIVAGPSVSGVNGEEIRKARQAAEIAGQVADYVTHAGHVAIDQAGNVADRVMDAAGFAVEKGQEVISGAGNILEVFRPDIDYSAYVGDGGSMTGVLKSILESNNVLTPDNQPLSLSQIYELNNYLMDKYPDYVGLFGDTVPGPDGYGPWVENPNLTVHIPSEMLNDGYQALFGK